MKVLPPTEIREARRREAVAARRRLIRAAALESASRLFARRGFHETGMADVAREAGVSLKGLYSVFDGKDDLFIAVLDDAFGLLLPLLGEEDGEREPGRRFLDLIDALFELVDEHRDFLLLYSRGSEGVPSSLREEGRDPYEPYAGAVRDGIAAVVAAAQKVGHAQGVPAEVVAQSLIATVQAVSLEAIAKHPESSVTKAAPGVRALYAPLFSG